MFWVKNSRSMYMLLHSHGSFSFQLVPSMLVTAQHGDDGAERDDVHKLTVEETLNEDEPHEPLGAALEREGLIELDNRGGVGPRLARLARVARLPR